MMNALRTLPIAVVLLCSVQVAAQSTIYSHAIGNWRNGPVVYITPLIETTEAMTKAQLMDRFRATYPALKDIAASDLDVLLFGTREEGDESRRTLHAKYGTRKLDVVMLEAPREVAVPVPTDRP